MERTLSRRAHQRLIRAAAVSLVVAAQAGANVQAGTVAGNGGATEITQIMNHIELITNALNTANTVRNTLQTVVNLKAQLTQLNPQTIAQMVGLPMDQINQLVGLYGQVNQVIGDYQQVQGLLQQATSESGYMNMTPLQYLQFRAQLAQRMGGVYMQSYLADQSKLSTLQQQAQQLQTMAAQIPGISSQVQGMQALQASNLQIASTMASLNQQMTQQNMIAMKEKADNEQDNSAAFKANLTRLAQYQQIQQQTRQTIQSQTLPDPTTILSDSPAASPAGN